MPNGPWGKTATPASVTPSFTDIAAGTASAWGSITGTLSAQTDLNTALGLKAPLASPVFTGVVSGPAYIASGNLSGYAANNAGIDHGGQTRIMDFGPNTTTQGSMAFNLYSSNASVVTAALQLFPGSANFSGTIAAVGNINAGNSTNANSTVIINGTAATIKCVNFSSAGPTRWNLLANADTGSENGGDLYFAACNDAGTLIDYPFSIVRKSAGGISFAAARAVSMGALTATSGTFSSSITQTGTFAAVGGLIYGAAHGATGDLFLAPGSSSGVIDFCSNVGTALVTIANSGATTFNGNSVSMGALTATTGTFSTAVNTRFIDLSDTFGTFQNMLWNDGGDLRLETVNALTVSAFSMNFNGPGVFRDDTAGFHNTLGVASAGTNGAVLSFYGNGSTTPNKYIRAYNGTLEFLNSAVNATPFIIYDDGSMSMGGGQMRLGNITAPVVDGNLYRWLYRSGNSLLWRYDGTNNGELLHTGNVSSQAATLQAAVAAATAPMVGLFSARPAYNFITGRTWYYYATDVTAPDGLAGTLYSSDGTAWSSALTPSVVAGRITAGVISAGAVGAAAIAADVALIGQVLRNTGFTAATYTSPNVFTQPSGFKMSGTAFSATYIDGSGSENVFMEIGANVSIGGLKATTIANRVRGNTFIQNGTGTQDIVIPEGVVSIEVMLQAAGGSGQAGGGDGGSAGSYIRKTITVKPHNTYRLTGGAVGSNSTFAWLSFDSASGFTTDSGFTTITAACGATPGTTSLDGLPGTNSTNFYEDPEAGWAITGGTGGHSNNAGSIGGQGGSCGLKIGGGSPISPTYANGGGGGASAMANGGAGAYNQTGHPGGSGTLGSGGGGGYTGGTGGACYCRVKW